METFEKLEMTTLTDCVNRLMQRGYIENFISMADGLEAPSNNRVYRAADVRIADFYRFEGESDPADNAICYAIETNDGIKGIVIDAYGGGNGDLYVSKFIADVQEIEKKRASGSG
jgi:hypothetical protein